MATFIFVHGANNDPREIAALPGLFATRSTEKGLSGSVLIAPPWRSAAGFEYGPLTLCLPDGWYHQGDKDPAKKISYLDVAGKLNPARHGQPQAGLTDLAVEHRLDSFKIVPSQTLADIFGYWTYRTQVHAVLDRYFDQLPEKGVIAVGHSLGGIVLLDYLAQRRNDNREATQICAVVTFGTPAPLMYALNALPALPFSLRSVPTHPWINVWDPRDFMSYLASDVFRSQSPATLPILDIEVACNAAFPTSHSLYWDQDGVWAAFLLALNSCGEWTPPVGQISASEARMLAHFEIDGDRAGFDQAAAQLTQRYMGRRATALAGTEDFPYDNTDIEAFRASVEKQERDRQSHGGPTTGAGSDGEPQPPAVA